MPHREKTKREGTEAAISAVLADRETGKEWPVPTTIVKQVFLTFLALLDCLKNANGHRSKKDFLEM
jgi:hypothetical protein